jgi:3-deoxy-D-manno-octulosonic-acid transferase
MIYRFFLNFWSKMVQILAPIVVRKRLKKGLENPKRFTERYGITPYKRPKGELIWFHGASVGESLSILPLIEKISAIKPQANFLITTTTIAAAKVLEMRIDVQNTTHQFIPFDAKPWVNKFLDHWKPSTAFFIESEIWPNILMAAHNRQIKTYLLNARLSEKSLRNWGYVQGCATKLWGCFSGIYTQSDEFTQRFNKLGAKQAQTLGNIKLLSAPLPFDVDEYDYWRSQIGNRKCWVVASTHDGEELQIFEVHKQLKKQFPDLLTIIAPRHMQRNDSICEIAKGLTIAKFSNRNLCGEDILLVDALAKLGVFYKICQLAFIGGSLIPQGGHNPLEPAMIGALPLWGAYFFNFDDMMPLFEGIPCQQHTPEQLIFTLQDFFKHPEKASKFVKFLQKNIVDGQNKIGVKVREILKKI